MSIKKSLTGAVLHASEMLNGSYFEDAVILIAVHDENGAFGLLLNRPSHMPIREVFNPVPDVTGVERRPFYVGGPVDEEGLHLIHLCGIASSHEGLMVAPGVELGGEWENIEEILLSNPNETFLFLGYSGWDSDQLEGELDEGSWDIYQPDVHELLLNWSTLVNASREEMKSVLENGKKS